MADTTTDKILHECKGCAHCEMLYIRDREKLAVSHYPSGQLLCSAPKHKGRKYVRKYAKRECEWFKRREGAAAHVNA